MFIPDPGSWFLPIPDPGSKNSNKRVKGKNLLSYLFCLHKFHIIENYLIFEMLKKKIWANFQRIIELFIQKSVTKLSKIWVWDPGSEIRDPGSGKNLFRILDPGVKKHRILDPDPQHCLNRNIFLCWFGFPSSRTQIHCMGLHSLQPELLHNLHSSELLDPVFRCWNLI